MKKFLTLLLTVALTATLAITGTVAYLTDTDQDVNTMVMGNVQIDQNEYERADVTKSILEDGNKKAFTQAKPLYPVVGEPAWDDASKADGATYEQKAWRSMTMNNVVDKYVTVKNTGKNDAYVRTIFALEMGALDINELAAAISASTNSKNGAEFPDMHWIWPAELDFVAPIDGQNYNIMVAVYDEKLAPNVETIPSLLQVYMKSAATNETCEKIDGNGNGTYDVIALSQAVQAEGFANATEALTAGFGAVDAANIAKWFDGIVIPTVSTNEGINYIITGTTAEISPAGGDTVARGILSEGLSDVTEVVVGEGITTLANRSLAKMPTLKSVSLPSTLTTLEEGALQGSAITEVEIPENVTYIGKQAIGYCPDIEKIVIKAKNVTIGNYVARACANLKEVYIYSDSVAFETGSMYFTNKENADASAITFYVKDQAMADNCYAAFSTSHSYGMLIKSLDGQTEFYNTLH